MSQGASRYIPAEINMAVHEASGFKCAWCGVHLTERHHIIQFAIVQEHTEDNLILLCPNCHTEATNGSISIEELRKRRLELKGEIDRASGSLSIPAGDFQVDVGGNHFINCRNIFSFNDVPLISVENEGGNLLVSMKIFNEKGNLTCWMSRNRWWVDGPAIKDFHYSKNKLTVTDNRNEVLLDLTINKNLIDINGYLYVGGNKISYSKEKIDGPRGGQYINNTMRGFENAIVFSDQPESKLRAGIRIGI
ncbi:MAG: HNH endonuclease signature motif containing protein [bacterium]|nr:HNH endonuclease signature motif containing protein [bacterium]